MTHHGSSVPSVLRFAFISLYRAIALFLSSSIMAFCAIDSTPSRFFPVLRVLSGRTAPLGSFVSSGGAWAMSFNRRGAEEDIVWNSFGLSACFEGIGVGEGDRSSSSTRFAFPFFLAFISVFRTFRALAREDWTAFLTRGRISLSIRLRISELVEQGQ